MNLAGRTVAITGGAGHIGRVMAATVAELGAAVAIIDIDPKSCVDTATAFYVTSPEFVMRTDSFWDGRVGAVEIPVGHAVDVDSKLDFEFAEFLRQTKIHR